MKFSFSLILSLVALATARKCGTPEPSEEHKEVSKEFAQEVANAQLNGRSTGETISVTIPVWFHVLRSGNLVSQGNIPNSQLTAQLNVLNNAYSSTGFKFNLAGTTRTTNTAWFNNEDEPAMRSALRKGDYKTLNIYFQNVPEDAPLGYCYFPEKPNSSVIVKDGCSIYFDSVPGGTTKNFNLGNTATHEIGHWLGLYHPFEGGCTGGDFVSDTPAEKTPTSGCPSSKDTCTGPKYPGADPIHNYMDFAWDSCMSEFTPGQATRMAQMWKKYRA